jgi:hypothetical protein
MSVSDQSLFEVGKAAFNKENFSNYLLGNEIKTIVFDFDRTLSVAEGFLYPSIRMDGKPSEGNPFISIKELVDAYERDLRCR